MILLLIYYQNVLPLFWIVLGCVWECWDAFGELGSPFRPKGVIKSITSAYLNTFGKAVDPAN